MKVTSTLEYVRLKRIGADQGANSEVYHIEDSQLGADLVAKETKRDAFRNPPDEYFEEARAMFSTASRNVVPIQYACQNADTINLVMPYYRGGSLEDQTRHGPVRLAEVKRIAIGALAGLARIHAKGIVHYDVKPSNVLLSERGEPAMADFGQARRMSQDGTSEIPKRLHIVSMPPEACSGGRASHLFDIYQFGLLLYRAANGDEMLMKQSSGQLLVHEMEVFAGRFPDRKQFMPHVPNRLRKIVRKALSVEPEDRFQSADELAAALGRMPIDVDWSPAPQSDGGFEWTAVRDGHADLVVRLSRNGTPNVWDVRVSTRNNGVLRAKNRAKYEKSGLTLSDAHLRLKEVFEDLR